MKLTFDINPETLGITLSIRFDGDDTLNGLQGKIRVLNYLKDTIERGNLPCDEKAHNRLAKLQVKVKDYVCGVNKKNATGILRSASKVVKKYGNLLVLDEDLRDILWKSDNLVSIRDGIKDVKNYNKWEIMAEKNIEELNAYFEYKNK